MNIYFDAEFLKEKPRGIAKSTLALYTACAQLAPDLKLTGIARKRVVPEIPDQIRILHIRPNAPRPIWRYLAFNACLAAYRPEVVHFPANGSVPRIHTSQNIVMTLHDVVQLSMPRFFSSDRDEARFRMRRQRDIDRSRIVLTVSEHSKNEILKHFHLSSEPVVLHNAPTLLSGRTEPIFSLDRTGSYFLYTGTYDPRKGLDTLVRVFHDLHRKKRIISRLYVAGERSYFTESFKTLMHEAVEDGAVQELGYVSDQELGQLLWRARALIYPSRYEGFGMPPVEAMHIGCPVITTPFSSLPEICGDAALFIDPDRHKEFGDAIVALETNEGLRAELIMKGKKQVERFSWERSAARFLELLAGLSQGRR